MTPRMNSYRLDEGDIVRIGRITTRIRTIKFKMKREDKKDNISINTELNLREINSGSNQILKSSSLEQIDKKPTLVKVKSKISNTEKNSNEDENKICRICYMEEESSDNPLVQPCICSGSMRYIHLNCLKHWLNTSTYNLLDSNDDYFLFLYKKAECELCKTKLPDYIRHKGKLYEIIDLHSDIPFNNYMILESLTLDKHNTKYIYVVSLDKNNQQINIGRGHESHLLLSDISVSRLHCFLTIDNRAKKIYLHDNHSKFGTLILIQAPSIKLAESLKLYLQIGKTFFEMLYLQNLCIFNCCCAGVKFNEDYYYKQNNVKLVQYKKLTVKTELDFDEQENNIGEINEEDIQNKEICITNINNANTNGNEVLEINREENININDDNNRISERENENVSESVRVDDEDNENENNDNNNENVSVEIEDEFGIANND